MVEFETKSNFKEMAGYLNGRQIHLQEVVYEDLLLSYVLFYK